MCLFFVKWSVSGAWFADREVVVPWPPRWPVKQQISLLLRCDGWTATKELTHWPLGNFEWNFRHVIFQQILVIDGSGVSCEIALIWMSLDFTDDQSTLVQVMAWCPQATSHYLSKCWPRSPFGVTWPQWVNSLRPRQNACHFADSFKYILFNENCYILFQISLKVVSKGWINSKPALVQKMAWLHTANKPLSEPILA